MDHWNKNHFWLKIELFQQLVFFGYLVKPRRVKEEWWMGRVMMDIVAWWCCSPIFSTISISTSRRSWRLDVPTCCNARTSGPEWPTDGPTRRPSTSSSKILIRPHKTGSLWADTRRLRISPERFPEAPIIFRKQRLVLFLGCSNSTGRLNAGFVILALLWTLISEELESNPAFLSVNLTFYVL